MARWVRVDQKWWKLRVELGCSAHISLLLGRVLAGDLGVVDCAVGVPGGSGVMVVSLLLDELV